MLQLPQLMFGPFFQLLFFCISGEETITQQYWNIALLNVLLNVTGDLLFRILVSKRPCFLFREIWVLPCRHSTWFKLNTWYCCSLVLLQLTAAVEYDR